MWANGICVGACAVADVWKLEDSSWSPSFPCAFTWVLEMEFRVGRLSCWHFALMSYFASFSIFSFTLFLMCIWSWHMVSQISELLFFFLSWRIRLYSFSYCIFGFIYTPHFKKKNNNKVFLSSICWLWAQGAPALAQHSHYVYWMPHLT